MAFDSDYWHALDKQSASNLEVSPKDIGISMGAGDVLEGLKSAINMGAGTVELGFTGAGKGSLGQGSTTPEMFGSDKREAIRQMAKINEVNVTTHATVSTQGLAGFDGQRGSFSDTASANSLNEIKRAIDFAADTTRGGPVTIHTGEFPREVREAPGGQFEPYRLKKGEIPKEELAVLVDQRTGSIIHFRKGQVIFEPEWVKNSADEFIDEQGNVLYGKDKWDLLKRVPKRNEKTDEIELKERTWTDIQKDTEQFNRDTGDHRTPEQFFVLRQKEAEVQRHKPFMMQWEEKYKSLDKIEKDCKEQIPFIKELEKSAKTPEAMEELKEYLMTKKDSVFRRIGEVPENQLPSEFLEGKQKELNRQKVYEREGWIGYQKEIKEVERLREDIVPVENFGVERSARNIAQAAMYAYEKEKQMKLEKPLFVSPENIFPETGYGSHPEELKHLVLESRKAMIQELEQRGYGSSEARQIAEDHVKATFDVGHAYTWKKFFKAEPGESFEQTEKRFNNWMLKEVDKLNDAGIIGHVHLSDNFGYYDEHLTPGTGSVPMKEFVEKMRKAGHMEPMIAEGGAQAKEDYYQAMTGGWKNISSSPIYRTAKWSDIEDSYFGRVSSPTYIVGKYAPSQEYLGSEKGAPFWTGIGLE